MDDKWQWYIDRALKNIGDDPEIAGKGKPLKLDDQAGVPDEFRSAFKIMKENDLAPDWVMAGKELDVQHDKIIKQLKTRYNDYQYDLSRAQTESVRLNVERVWDAQKQKIQELIDAYNDKTLTYNLKVPIGIPHRHLLRLHILLEALSQ
jgi:hypothetical protein